MNKQIQQIKHAMTMRSYMHESHKGVGNPVSQENRNNILRHDCIADVSQK